MPPVGVDGAMSADQRVGTLGRRPYWSDRRAIPSPAKAVERGSGVGVFRFSARLGSDAARQPKPLTSPRDSCPGPLRREDLAMYHPLFMASGNAAASRLVSLPELVRPKRPWQLKPLSPMSDLSRLPQRRNSRMTRFGVDAAIGIWLKTWCQVSV